MTAAPLPVRDRATGRPGRASAATLRLVPATTARPGRTPFVILVLALLAAGLLALLLLNTAIAQDAFRLHELQRQAVVAADRQQQLDQALTAARSPALLAARATALGMVPGSAGEYVRLADGRVVAAVSAIPRPVPPASPRPVVAARPAVPSPAARTSTPAKPAPPARPTPAPTPSRR